MILAENIFSIFSRMRHNVSSISGVHYSDEAKLCNKFHITNKEYWD